MDEKAKMESKLSSPAAFVEGGIQDACDDSCSICLEAFCDSNPSTVTSCKHEFHLQCMLEWCQRSSQCPMCWQSISLKDPTSQELLEAVEQERSMRVNRSRTPAVFHHPMLGDFELPHLPAGADDAELEERIIQHLAAAAAIRRTHRNARREGHRSSRSAAHGRPQILVFSTNEATSGGFISMNSRQEGENEPTPTVVSASPSVPLAATEEGPRNGASQLNLGHSDEVAAFANSPGVSSHRIYAGQSTPVSQERTGPSDLQSFSESLKSRLQSASMRYKECVTKSTRGWRERWFSRNTTISDLGSEVRREVNAGIAAVSRMMERLDTRDGMGSSTNSSPTSVQTHSPSETSSQIIASTNSAAVVNDGCSSASCVARSGSH